MWAQQTMWNLRLLSQAYESKLDLHAVPKDRVKPLHDGTRE